MRHTSTHWESASFNRERYERALKLAHVTNDFRYRQTLEAIRYLESATDPAHAERACQALSAWQARSPSRILPSVLRSCLLPAVGAGITTLGTWISYGFTNLYDQNMVGLWWLYFFPTWVLYGSVALGVTGTRCHKLRVACVTTLGVIGTVHAVRPIAQISNESDGELRSEARLELRQTLRSLPASALRRLDAQQLKWLRALLPSADPALAKTLLRVLALAADATALPTIRRMEHKSRWRAARTAASRAASLIEARTRIAALPATSLRAAMPPPQDPSLLLRAQGNKSLPGNDSQLLQASINPLVDPRSNGV
jgi:hypothetical protein